MTATGPSLEELLTKQVLRNTSRRIRGLTITLDGETVVLGGTAPSFHVKQLALHAVRELLPYSPLRNRIQVAEQVVA